MKSVSKKTIILAIITLAILGSLGYFLFQTYQKIQRSYAYLLWLDIPIKDEKSGFTTTGFDKKVYQSVQTINDILKKTAPAPVLQPEPTPTPKK